MSAAKTTKSLSIDKRSNGTYRGRYTINAEQVAIYAKTKKELLQKWAALNVAEPTKRADESGLTVGAWLSEYVNLFTRNIKDTTRLQYEKNIKNHIIPALGSLPLRECSALTVQKFYNSLAQEKHLSAKTVKNIHGVLHKAFGKAKSLKYISVNPCGIEYIELPRCGGHKAHPLDINEIQRYFAAVQKSRYRLALTFLPLTGLRVGELLGLKFSDVDYTNKQINLARQLVTCRRKGDAPYCSTPKNGRGRSVVLPEQAIAILKQAELSARSELLRKGEITRGVQDLYIFPCAYESLRREFKQILKVNDFENIRLHDLRHSFVVLAQKAGLSIKSISATLGHATVAFTLDIYGAFLKCEREENAELLTKAINDIIS